MTFSCWYAHTFRCKCVSTIYFTCCTSDYSKRREVIFELPVIYLLVIFYSSHSCTLSVQSCPVHNNGLGQKCQASSLEFISKCLFVLLKWRMATFECYSKVIPHFSMFLRICNHSDSRNTVSS